MSEFRMVSELFNIKAMLKHYAPQIISRNKLIIILHQNPADRQQVVSQTATRWKIPEAKEAFLLKRTQKTKPHQKPQNPNSPFNHFLQLKKQNKLCAVPAGEKSSHQIFHSL